MTVRVSRVLWLCMATGAGGCNPKQDPTIPRPAEMLIASDTMRPAVPDHDPRITTDLVVTPPNGAGHLYHRNVLTLIFDDSTGGRTVRNVLQRYSATIIGGFVAPDAEDQYFVQVPDPGPTWKAVHALVQRIGSEGGVKMVGPLTAKTYIQIRGNRPSWPVANDTTRPVMP